MCESQGGACQLADDAVHHRSSPKDRKSVTSALKSQLHVKHVPDCLSVYKLTDGGVGNWGSSRPETEAGRGICAYDGGIVLQTRGVHSMQTF